MAGGLIAGESLTGVLFAGLVLVFADFTSVTKVLFGVDRFAWVAGPAGAWTSLLALAAIAWLLVRASAEKGEPISWAWLS